MKDLKLYSTNCCQMVTNDQYMVVYGVYTYLEHIQRSYGPLGTTAQWSKWLIINRKIAQLLGGTALNQQVLETLNLVSEQPYISFNTTQNLVGAILVVFELQHFKIGAFLDEILFFDQKTCKTGKTSSARGPVASKPLKWRQPNFVWY